MALFHFSFLSNALMRPAEVDVFLPECSQSSLLLSLSEMYNDDYVAQKYKTLVLLHGAWDDGKCWITKCNATRYANEKGIALVMPTIGNDYYNDHGNSKCYTYIVDELLPYVRKIFPLSSRKEDTYIAGLAVGAFGAMKAGLKRSDLFSAIGILSISDITSLLDDRYGPFSDVFGRETDVIGSDNDLISLLKSPAKDIRILQICGSRDEPEHVEWNRYLVKKAQEYGYSQYTYMEDASGDHSWDFWDMAIKKVIHWL